MISLLVPSRGRPEQLAAMWATANETASGPLELVVRLDHDDPAEYPDLGEIRIVGPRGLLSAYWNECYEQSSGGIVMHAGDDIRFRTAEWDVRVREAFDDFPDGIVFVHGEDGHQHDRLGTHGFLSRRWVETVGYFVPPMFSSDFNDTWLTEVADRIGRRVFLPNVLTEHMHPAAGKGTWDRTHLDRLERHHRDQPERIYEQTVGERMEAAAKLRKAMV